MKKRILALMLACFMIVSLLPMQVFAEETVTKCPGAGADHVKENCTYEEVKVVDPTCIAWGYTIYACSVCGDHFVDDIVEKTEEHVIGHVDHVDPNCATQTNGVVGGDYCLICGEGEAEARAEIAWEHEFDVVVGNCLEGTTKTCVVCGYVEFDARGEHCYIDPVTGEYLITSVINPEDNTDPNLCGIGIYTCYYCNEEHEVQILHNLHFVPATDYNCTVDGNIDHYECTTCDKTFTVGSVEGEWVEVWYDWYHWDWVWVPGYLETLEALQGGYGYLENVTKLVEVDPTVPARCDYVVVDSFDGSCTEQAWEKFECVRCGDTYTEYYDVVHSYNVVLVYDPTCTTYGYTVYFCDLCGTTFEDSIVPPLGHLAGEPVVENYVGATCTDPGSYDAVTYCVHCGDELSRQTITIEALDHDWYMYSELKPNCSTLGHQYFICTRCGEQKHEVLDRDPNAHYHGDDAPLEIILPTCTEDGGELYYCYWCDDNYIVTEGYEALGHVLYTHTRQDCDSIETTTWCEFCDYEEYTYEEFAPDRTLVFESVEEAVAAHSTYDTYSCENQRNPEWSWGPQTLVFENCYSYNVKQPTCGNIGYEYFSCTCCEGSFVAILPETGNHVSLGYLASTTVSADGNAEGQYVYGIDFKGGLIEIMIDFTNGYAEPLFLDAEGNQLQPDSVGSDGYIVRYSFHDVEYVEVRAVVYYGSVVITPYLESSIFDGYAPTCDEEGKEDYWYCIECRKMVGGEAIESHGRYTVHAENKAPTCHEDGWIIGDYCPVCDEYTTFDEDGNRYVINSLVVPALGHDIIVNWDAFQVEDWMAVIFDERRLEHSVGGELFAYTHYVCANGCGLEYIADYHNGVDHTWVLNEDESYAPTCTQNGADIYYCDCGEVKIVDLPALGHNFTEDPADGCCSRCDMAHDYVLIATMPATCSVGEYELYLCSNCGHEHAVTTSMPDPDAHVWGETEEIMDENGHATGVLFHICTLCGAYEDWDAEHYVNYILSTEDTIFVPGSTIAVTITLDANYADVWGFDVNVFFDATKVAFVGYTASSVVFDYLIEAQENVDGDDHFIGVAATAVDNGVVIEDVVVTLYFQALDYGFAQFELVEQSTMEINGEPVTAYGDVENITIYQIMDIDMDGDIDLEDLRLCYVIMTAADFEYNILADADCDNDIDPEDVLLIYRHILSH